MKWTGNSDYDAIKSYIDIAGNIQVNTVNRFS